MKAKPPKPASYSYSKLDTFRKCPWAYMGIYLDKLPRQVTPQMNVGRQSHDLVAQYLRRLIEHKIPSDLEWARGVLPRLYPEASPDLVEVWDGFVNSFTLPATWKNPKVENRLAFDRDWNPTGWFEENAFFRLAVDLHFQQDSLVVVKDWKSGWAVLDIEKDLQTRLYGWAVNQAIYPDAKEILLVLHYLRSGTERKILLVPEDLAGIPAQVEEIVAQIESERHFAPTLGDFCGWCGLVPYCPAMKKTLVPEAVRVPTSPKEAQEAAALLWRIETLAREIKKILKIYVQEAGPIKLGDLVYGPVATEEWNLNPQAVTDLALLKGLDRGVAWAMLSITKSSIEKALKKAKAVDLLPDLLGTGVPIPGQQIRFSKLKEKADGA